MRTLKLQMQITIDGFVARPDGTQDWMKTGMDKKAVERVIHIADESDTIIMGRKMSKDFLPYWEKLVDSGDTSNPEWGIGTRMVEMKKIIFSKTLKTTDGRNARVENGDMKTVINKLKSEPGKDILVYGGANFVSNLIKEDLIDDYYFFVNPVGIGEGMKIIYGTKKLKFVETIPYTSGVIVNHYKPER